MEAPLGYTRLSPEVWKEIFQHLPILSCTRCCRVCRAWQQDLEQPQEGQGDDVLVDYGLVTLCSVLATEGADVVLRRIRLHYPSGIAADLGRMDQVRRFVQHYRGAQIQSEGKWWQLASQEPDAGWLCKGTSKTQVRGMLSLMRQDVGKPQNFSKLLDTMEHSASVSFVRYSPDGSTIACVGSDTTVRLLDAKTMEEKGSLKGHMATATVHSVAFSPDSKLVASGSGEWFEGDNSVRIWDVSTGEEVCCMTGHSGCVYSVAWSPDGEMVASGGLDEWICLWSKSGEIKLRLKVPSDFVRCIAYSPDGKRIAWASDDKTVRIFDLENRRLVRPPMLHHGVNPDCKCKLPDGDRNKITSYFKVKCECPWPVTGHSGAVHSVAWSPDGEMIASGSEDKTVCLWSKSGEHKGTLKEHWKDVNCVAWSPDGEFIASASDDKTVCLWRKSGELKGTLTGHPGPVLSVAYSPDGSLLASAGGDGDSVVRVWDPRSQAEHQGTSGGHSEAVTDVAWSPDGGFVASAGEDKTVCLWGKSGELKSTLMGHSGVVSSVAWSPDGEMIASGSYDKTVCLWSKSGEHKGTLRVHTSSIVTASQTLTFLSWLAEAMRLPSGE